MRMSRFPSYPAFYGHLYPALVKVANAHGYALAIHGSLSRDMDLVAVAWAEHASPARELVAAIRAKVGGFEGEGAVHGPTKKPHGRIAWSIILGGHAYIDLSVIPQRRLRKVVCG